MAERAIVVETDEDDDLRPPAPRRRHAEILAPRAPALTAKASRRAWRAVLILLGFAILIQPLSVPMGHYLYARVDGGTDIYSQWRQYAARPAPDVLFIGASDSWTDVDTSTLSGLLSNAAGRPVTVEALGIGAAQPNLLDALMYRVMSLHTRPKTVVFSLETPMFNRNFVCSACGRDPLTSNLWQLADTADPGYYRLAFQNDPNRLSLAAGLALPSLAYYPSIGAVDCPVVSRMRWLFQHLGPVPRELQRSTPCDFAADATHRDYEMKFSQMQGLVYVYQEEFLGSYEISPELVAEERDMVRRAQAGGATAVFVRPPFHSSIRNSDAVASSKFLPTATSLAAELGAPVIDLSVSVPDDSTYWYDPLHLNRKGARRLAPVLAEALLPVTAGTSGQAGPTLAGG